MCFNAVEFGKRLRDLRDREGMTQKELARKVNVEEQHINRMERGKRACSIDVLLKISETLNVSTDYLLKGNRMNSDQTKAELLLVIEHLVGIVQKM